MPPALLQKEPWPWKNFPYEELERVSHSGVRMEPEFLDMLQKLRIVFAEPMRITSAYRNPGYNDSVSTTGRTGPHTTGRAVDIHIFGTPAYDLVRMALNIGFSGIGLKQHGDHSGRFIHLDTLMNATGQPRAWIWSYP